MRESADGTAFNRPAAQYDADMRRSALKSLGFRGASQNRRNLCDAGAAGSGPAGQSRKAFGQ